MKKNKKDSTENVDECIKKNKVKFSEKMKHVFRKNIVLTGTKTALIVAILFLAYISINLWITQTELPEIDVTENKLYSLTDTSKEAVEKVDKNITAYAYGFTEDDSVIKLLKQYHDVNDKLNYELISEETNKSMVEEYNLTEGYHIIILKSDDSENVIDASQDFSTYDNVTGQTVDTTEQTLTNAYLSLCDENKTKVYFVQGHEEYSLSKMVVLSTYLGNEAFEYDTLDIVSAGTIPEDCDVLAIMSPSTDYLDVEVNAIKDYINKGGNIFATMDVLSENTVLTNLQSILGEYGVTYENGYIIETLADNYMAEQAYIFKPQINSTNDITKDIYSDSYMWLVYSGRLNFKSDEELTNMGVTKEILLSSSEKDSFFTSNLSTSFTEAISSATPGKSDIAAIMTKSINKDVTAEDGTTTTETKKSNLIVVATGSFISDYTVSALNNTYPISYIGSNKDFVINSMAFLGNKDNSLRIRKDYSSSTVYTATDKEQAIVKTIAFAVPIAIILVGVSIGVYRRKRK